MSVYILEASARKKGYSAQAAKIVTDILESRNVPYTYDRAFPKNIGYCLACDRCLDESVNCVQMDEMQPVYEELMNASTLLFITPITFSSVPAQMKVILDRCQRFYNRHFERPSTIPAYFIYFGGSKPYSEQFAIAPLQFKHLLSDISATSEKTLAFPGTDNYSGTLPEEAKKQISALAVEIAAASKD